MNPHVRLCEPLCDLLRGGAASLPRRRISGRFWADFRGLLRLCGGRKQRQEKGIGAFLRQRRSRQPAVRTVTRVYGVLRLTLIIGPRMYFGAILCKKARQLRVYKAFGGRRHTEGRCSSIDENGKSRHSVWLSDDVWQEVDAFYKLDNCPIRNEFAEKALRQYCGRLHAERTGAYLPRALQGVLEGTLGVFGERLGRLLLKLAVEHNMTNHLLGGDMDMTRDEYSKMRGSSVREVSATHGTISFKDVLLFYKED